MIMIIIIIAIITTIMMIISIMIRDYCAAPWPGTASTSSQSHPRKLLKITRLIIIIKNIMIKTKRLIIIIKNKMIKTKRLIIIIKTMIIIRMINISPSRQVPQNDHKVAITAILTIKTIAAVIKITIIIIKVKIIMMTIRESSSWCWPVEFTLGKVQAPGWWGGSSSSSLV